MIFLQFLLVPVGGLVLWALLVALMIWAVPDDRK